MPLKRKFETTTTKRVPFTKHPGYTLEVHNLGGFLSNVQFALIFDTERVLLNRRSMTIGRGDMNDIDVRDENNQVSRVHAKLEHEAGGFALTDMGSTNGTYLNGNILEKRKKHPLNAGDTIIFGKCVKAVYIKLDSAPRADEAYDLLPTTASSADSSVSSPPRSS